MQLGLPVTVLRCEPSTSKVQTKFVVFRLVTLATAGGFRSFRLLL